MGPAHDIPDWEPMRKTPWANKEQKLVDIAGIMARGWLRLSTSGVDMSKEMVTETSIHLAIPAPQSDESEPGLNSTTRLGERGSDV